MTDYSKAESWGKECGGFAALLPSFLQTRRVISNAERNLLIILLLSDFVIGRGTKGQNVYIAGGGRDIFVCDEKRIIFVQNCKLNEYKGKVDRTI